MKVDIVVFDGVQALDVAGPLDVFAEANHFLPEALHYQTSLISLNGSEVCCSNGMRLVITSCYHENVGQSDLLLVAGGPCLPDLIPEATFLSWLRQRALAAGRFGSICNGTFLLGHAGLLDGRQVTTHWSDAARLANDFPAAHIKPDKIFVRDGRLLTSAGVTAGIDLCLALVAEDHGHALAVRIAKQLVVYIQREGGQSQFSPYLPGKETSDFLTKIRDYIVRHLSEVITIDQLAQNMLVSRRTFTRLFQRHAQVTPSAYVEQLRVDIARQKLEETDAPLKTVAFECGFHSATHMRMIFMRRLDVTPQQYRRRFQGGTMHNNPDVS